MTHYTKIGILLVVGAGCFDPQLIVGLGAKGESLWINRVNNERGMFADRRASRRGDILTVQVQENSSVANSQETKTDKSVSIANAVRQWLFPSSVSRFGTHKGALPSTDVSSENSYAGGGEISNRHSVQSRLSVLVIDVLPNRNLVVEGVRQVTFSGETYFMVLRGFVRPEDVNSRNTIQSSSIANARVEIFSEGTITDAQRKGWLMRFNDLINPF